MPRCVDAHRLGARIATLSRGPLLGRGLRPAENRDVCDASVGGNHGGNGLDAERNRADQRAGLRVEHGERIVRRQRQHGESLSIRAGRRRDGWCAGHEVAECHGAPLWCGGIAGGVGAECAEIRDGRLSRGRSARRRGGCGQPSHGRHERAMRERIDGHAVDAGRSIQSRARDRAVGAPVQPVGRARRGDPELVGVSAESHAGHAAVEHALHAGGRDALSGGDDAGIGDVAVWGGLSGRLCLKQYGEGKMEHGIAQERRCIILSLARSGRHCILSVQDRLTTNSRSFSRFAPSG